MTNLDWMTDSLCAQVSPEFFDATNDGRSYAQGKALCTQCPVALQCLQWAIETDTNEGLYGGLSPREHRELVAA